MELDLDDDGPTPSKGVATSLTSAPPADAADAAAAGPSSAGRKAIAQPTPASSGSQMDDELERRHNELLAMAGYPEPPANLLACVAYSWGVFRRQRELRHEVEAHALRFQQLERGVRSQFAEIADAARARMPDQLDSYFEEADSADDAVSERQQAVMDGAASHATHDSSLAARLSELSDDHGAKEDAVKAALIQLEDAQSQQRRTDIEHKRAVTQLNAAHDAAREAAAEGARFAPPEHARRITKRQAVEEAIKRQLDARNETLKSARDAFHERQRALRKNEREMNSTAAERRRLDNRAGKAKDAELKSLHGVEEERLEAIEYALRAIEADLPGALLAEDLLKMTELDAQRDAGRDALELQSEAITAYDKDGFNKGIGFVLGGVLLLVALALLIITS
jgi:hypothetical protein